MLKDQAKSWATEQAPVSQFRAMRNAGVLAGFETTTWETMVEMGWTGILVPEEYGGSGLGYLTFGVVLEELGRQLTASPLLASALVGASALVLGGNDTQKQRLLPRVVDGSEILTLAVDESPRHAPEHIQLSAHQTAEGYLLNGQKTFVMEGMSATTFVVVARTSGASGERAGVTLFLVPSDSAGLNRSAMKMMDSRGYAQVEFNDVAVGADAILGSLDQGYDLAAAVIDRACAGIAAEMMGVAAAAFDMTLDYLKTREQFGRVIGSFQALGHRAAELYKNMELSRSCMEAALQAIDDDTQNTALMCSLSKAKMGEFLFEMSNQLIQIHGGIGMTDEYDAGLYLKRARPLEALFGNQAYHRDRYARLSGF